MCKLLLGIEPSNLPAFCYQRLNQKQINSIESSMRKVKRIHYLLHIIKTALFGRANLLLHTAETTASRADHLQNVATKTDHFD